MRDIYHINSSLLQMPMLMYPAELEVSISVSLPLHPYFLYASSEGSGESLNSSLTGVTVLWALSMTHLSLLSTGSTQEDCPNITEKLSTGT